MRKGWLVLGLLFFWVEGYAKEDSGVKYQMETGLKIKSEVAQRILSKFSFESQAREDYYIEIYDGTSFLIIPSPELYRFRLKTTGSRSVLQVNTKKRVIPSKCLNGETFRVEEKAVGELRLNQTKAHAVVDLIEDQLNLMNGQTLSAVGSKIFELHRQIELLPIPLKEKLLSLTGGRRWLFTASHTSSKMKHKLERDMGWGPLEISVTEGHDFVGTQMIQKRSEIEFQAGEQMTVEQFTSSVCSFLQEIQLSESDRELDIQDPQDTTLPLLRKYNLELGFPN